MAQTVETATVLEPALTRRALYIAGEWRAASGDGNIEVESPATEEIIGAVPRGVASDVDAAVQAARTAFPEWSASSATDRAEQIERLGAALAANVEPMAHLIATEVGMPMRLCRPVQAAQPAQEMSSFATVARELEWEQHVGNSLVVREAAGVVAAITPWNVPLHQIVIKVGAALAAGCTLVVKPSGMAPLNAYFLADLVDMIGLPAGVFNVVTGEGRAVGEALASHPDVDVVSFTGSTGAGRRVMELAAGTIKRVSLELGGKSANILLDDADFPRAVRAGVNNAMLNSGQTCNAQTRMLVPQSRQQEAVELAVAALSGLRVGDPLDDGSRLGPVISAEQRERIVGYMQRGLAEGARLVAGGSERPEGLERGYYVKPTIFADVTPTMTIAREEIFGPVMSIMPYADEEDAVRIANDSAYGLAGGVWSADADRAMRVAKRLRTGQVDINGGRFNILAPFGGYKQSGVGRELGRYGVEEFLETKALQL